MGSSELQKLGERVGRELLARRLRLQSRNSAWVAAPGQTALHWEHWPPLAAALGTSLTVSGLLGRAARNTLGYQSHEIEVAFEALPDPFEGFRILHLSDLHIDAIVDDGQRLRRVIEDTHFDLCVVTGDFRFSVSGDYRPTLERLERLVKVLACECGVVGILGNHDDLEMVPPMEELGIRVLLNEAISVERGGRLLWLAGVDDPHRYGTHDLEKALAPVTDAGFTLLLAHSPEIIDEAAAAGVDYYLCGHTHGGQICLPGGIAVLKNASCPRKFVSGFWRHGRMAGYTSKGAGYSMFPARFFCPPEVTVHRLTRGCGSS